MLAGRHHGYQALGQKPHFFQRIALSIRAISQDDGMKSSSSSQYSNMLRAGSPELLVMDLEEKKQIMDWYTVSSGPSSFAEGCPSEIVYEEGSTQVSDVKSDFFETLDWAQAQQESLTSSKSTPSPQQRPQPYQNENSSIFGTTSTLSVQPMIGLETSRGNDRRSRNPRSNVCMAEAYECQAGVRVEQIIDPYNHKYHYDSDKETPILTAPTPPQLVNEFDLLDLGGTAHILAPEESASKTMPDPFSDLLKDAWPTSSVPTVHTDNLLEEWSSSSNLPSSDNLSYIHRNVSAPAFQRNPTITLDPFAEFLSQSASSPTSAQASASNSGSTTPKPARPNYSRAAFESLNTNASIKTKVSGDAFGDLLSSQGFTASSKNVNRTLGDLRKAEEMKDLDPVIIKINSWVKGKERNIRALLGSLNDVLWEGAETWKQPRMADLLSDSQVKRSYHKACLLVHPDKQVGAAHEKLARAIFTELNDAWNAFEQAGGQL